MFRKLQIFLIHVIVFLRFLHVGRRTKIIFCINIGISPVVILIARLLRWVYFSILAAISNNFFTLKIALKQCLQCFQTIFSKITNFAAISITNSKTWFFISFEHLVITFYSFAILDHGVFILFLIYCHCYNCFYLNFDFMGLFELLDRYDDVFYDKYRALNINLSYDDKKEYKLLILSPYFHLHKKLNYRWTNTISLRF